MSHRLIKYRKIMRTIDKVSKHLAAGLAAVALMLAGCQDEALFRASRPIEEGIPTRVLLGYAAQDNIIETRAEQTEEYENRIENIYEVAALVQELVPDARIVVGHGQMKGEHIHLLEKLETNPPRGECVLIIEGRSFEELEEESRESFLKMPLEEHMAIYLNQGYSRKEAMKMTAKDRGVSKRDIYQQLLQQK